ncbi:MAG: hypothetical protein IIB95_01535 [Candidatus Marinimicrobia bacterium]|nr:hypothetical protein [Candidatus Neomarinimicrobiota bacterium]
MQNFLTLILISSLLFPQKIFKSFDYNSDHSFVGINSYEFTMDEDGKENRILIIKDIFGDITIIGQETYKVNIKEEIKIRSRSEHKAKKYYEENPTEIKKSVDGNMIEIRGNSWHRKNVYYHFSITLPVHFNIQTMITGGDIKITNIFGVVHVITSGGDIKLNGISGKIEAKTSSGDIEVRDSEGNVRLTTSGGDIEVLYTDGQISGTTSGGDITVRHVEGNVNVSTSGGSIDFSYINGQKIVGITSGGDIDAEDIRGNIELRTSGGDIEVEDVDGNFYGKTSGGDIDLESVNGQVEIYTSAGSIKGFDLAGSIQAETSSGEIEIYKIWNTKLDRHDIDLITSHGNIKLNIPREFPSTINARISGHKSSYEIVSDFPISITTDFNNIYGHFVNGDGTYTIELQTRNGDINIEEED